MGAKLPTKTKEEILAYWRTGSYSQDELAKNFCVSKGYVNKICKSVTQDMTAIVEAGVTYLKGLDGADEKLMTAVNETVTTQARLSSLVTTFNERAVIKALSLVEKIDTGQELRNVVEAVDKVTITAKLSERHASGSSTVINNSAQAAAIQKPLKITFKGK